MTDRRLVAAFACRAASSRLYGKPLQALGPDRTILEHLLAGAAAAPEIATAVLGIAEGLENMPFVDLAREHDLPYIVGDEKDVLWRLILCGRVTNATDVFRVTSECPFPGWEDLARAWKQHVEHENDITALDHVPEGVSFEIYRLAALERAHDEANDAERSEMCSAYPRRRPDRFRIEVVLPSEQLQRLDLRLTVDYPEDLVLCRAIFAATSHLEPHIPLAEIVSFVDAHPELHALVAPFVDPTPTWTPVLRQ